jgi:Fur family transcriptional regulator, peroxide stress response regulator
MMQDMLSFENACRQAGLRVTPQRLEIFRELSIAADHPSAETIHKRLLKKFPTISLDTVYRTLATFAQQGLIDKVETVESQARFEVRISRHQHLVCSRCKRITDFIWSSFEEAELPEELAAWGRIEKKNAVVYGVCRRCQENNGGPTLP